MRLVSLAVLLLMLAQIGLAAEKSLSLVIQGTECVSVSQGRMAYNPSLADTADVLAVHPGKVDFLLDIAADKMIPNPINKQEPGWVMGIKTKSHPLGEGTLRVHRIGSKVYVKVTKDNKEVSYWVFSSETELCFWIT